MANKPKKPKISAGAVVRSPFMSFTGPTNVARAPEREENPALAWLNRPARQGLNFLGDLSGGFQRNKFDSWGTGVGDQLFGVTPGYYAEKRREAQDPRYNDKQTLLDSLWGAGDQSLVNKSNKGIWDYQYDKSLGPYPQPGYAGKNTSGGGPAPTDEWGALGDPRSFADILRDVQGMLSEMGVGGSVSYDPLRSQARAQWSDADARTLAMFNQLQDSIRGEAAGLTQAYDQGITSTNEATQFANEQNAQSAQNVASMVGQQAGALGIQEAVANDINAGNLSGQDQMARAADTTARGQITSNMLNSNKVGALDFNNDLVGSAGLAGGMARLQRQNELQRLLAGYDVQEQEANARSQGDFLSQSTDLARSLFGEENENWQFQSNARRDALKEANDQKNWEAEFPYKYGSPAKSSTKAPVLPRDAAFQRALDDFGYGSLEEAQDNGNRQKVIAQANKYMGL